MVQLQDVVKFYDNCYWYNYFLQSINLKVIPNFMLGKHKIRLKY